MGHRIHHHGDDHASFCEIPISDDEFESFRSLIHQQTGVVLKDPKRALLQSRLIRRLRHHGHQSFAEYYNFLLKEDAGGAELQEMINAITTHKTSFFREAHHFESLNEHLFLPARRLAAEGRRPSLRIWSAGCSSGEEPYSIAITAMRTLDHLPGWDLKILATDIDTEMVEKARIGMYPRDTEGIPKDALKQCFISGTDEYADYIRVKPLLRNLITFGRLNLMDDLWPLRRKFDAIFCRNVIIYFNQESQRRVIEHFARYLKPGGLFFAGHSENLFFLSHLLEPIGGTVYRLRPTGAKPEATVLGPIQ